MKYNYKTEVGWKILSEQKHGFVANIYFYVFFNKCRDKM